MVTNITMMSNMHEYLYSIRYYVLITSALFVGSLAFGYLVIHHFINFNMIKELLPLGLDMHPAVLTLVIFLNNSLTCALAIILGLTIGIVPIAITFINGSIIGFVGYWITHTKGLLFFLAAILPHGVIEVPVFLLSCAIGLRIGVTVLKRGKTKEELKRGLRLFLYFLPLLLLAALTEVCITPAIISIYQ